MLCFNPIRGLSGIAVCNSDFFILFCSYFIASIINQQSNKKKKKKQLIPFGTRLPFLLINYIIVTYLHLFIPYYHHTPQHQFLPKTKNSPHSPAAANMTASFLLLLSAAILISLSTTASSIGLNYGTIADNLPPPSQVAKFITTQTIIDSIKIFDANPDILRAFANTNVKVTVTVGNGDIPALTDAQAARQWVAANIKPYYPATKINRISIGNEILATGNKVWISRLVPCMWALHNALVQAGITDIQVSTPHTLEPMLKFLRQTKSPLMVNPYPYFSYAPSIADYALFRPNRGVHDSHTNITYYNMFEAMMDAVYSAIKAMGYADVDIVVAETGWPSAGDPNQPACTVDNAISFNSNLIKAVTSGKGTPLMPNRKFETYVFALFNENQKPGQSNERNWGLFRPDLSAVYNVGILKNNRKPSTPMPAPVVGKKSWCVPKAGASDQALQGNINYVCSQKGMDCKPIQAGGACFTPGNVRSHASYVMNSFYRHHGGRPFNCDFAGTGAVTFVDPSKGSCKYM
ncbi:Glucan endo-1,3-beta-glucosidase [Linum perenne]